MQQTKQLTCIQSPSRFLSLLVVELDVDNLMVSLSMGQETSYKVIGQIREIFVVGTFCPVGIFGMGRIILSSFMPIMMKLHPVMLVNIRIVAKVSVWHSQYILPAPNHYSALQI